MRTVVGGVVVGWVGRPCSCIGFVLSRFGSEGVLAFLRGSARLCVVRGTAFS